MEKIHIYSETQQFNNDITTPMGAFLRLNQPNAFLLESVIQGRNLGQFSMIGFDPLIEVQGYENYIVIVMNDDKFMIEGNPLEKLKEFYQSITQHQEEFTPIKTGFFGYFTWDIMTAIENIELKDKTELLFEFQLPKSLLIFDHVQQLLYITHSSFQKMDTQPLANKIIEKMDSLLPGMKSTNLKKPETLDWSKVSMNVTKEEFEDYVEKVKEHIKEGDIFQGVLSQKFRVEREKDSISVYRSLRHINPSPYMFYFNYGDYKIIGSSPEILVQSKNSKVTVRPIAGTRKRTFKNEKEIIEELKADEKEKAEHIMLVDLGRNDLGRVCDFDSIKISDLMTIEKYSHVIHMVSNVVGDLKVGQTPIDVIKATFPAGTVSGAPKIRAIEIIDELEPDQRSIYSGAVGYFNLDGDIDLCIAIRTIIADSKGYTVQAGAGIVNDSVPENEYFETRNKAHGILMACFKGDDSDTNH